MVNFEPDDLFTCTDFAQRRVTLSRAVADHVKARHPDIVPFLERVCDVLDTPDFAFHRSRVNSHLFYRLGVLSGRLANTCMVVIVRYNEEGEGQVRTVYPTTQPARGDTLLYVRPRRGA